jgi:hypothetical protein
MLGEFLRAMHLVIFLLLIHIHFPDASPLPLIDFDDPKSPQILIRSIIKFGRTSLVLLISPGDKR